MSTHRPASVLLLTVFCALAPAQLCAQVGGYRPTDPNPKSSEPCSVEGIVLRADTNEPIRRAQVTLQSSGRAGAIRTFTDAEGKFSLRDVPPGSYFLSAERQGFIRQGFGQRNTPQSGSALQLTAGQAVKDVVFRLVPWAVISGRVYDEEGEPLVGANVEVLRYSYSRGRRQLQRTQIVNTDDRGEYRMFGLQPGRYFVDATYFPGGRVRSFGDRGARPAPSAAPSDQSYAPTYYPGTNDPSRALPLDLRGGQEMTGLDFSLQLTPTVRVRGRVANGLTGATVRGAQVSLWPREGDSRGLIIRGQDVTDSALGEFEIRGVIPGSYYLSAAWYDQGRSMTTRIPLDVGGSDVEGINLTLGPSGTLDGIIKVEGGGPLPQTVSATPLQIGGGNVQIQRGSLRLALFPIDDAMPNVLTAASMPNGTFNFREVFPASYTLVLVDPPGGYYLKSAVLGGKNVLDAGLDLRSGSPGVSLDVTISPNGARLDGVVMADEQHAAPGAVVVLVPDTARRNQWSLFKIVTADTSGQFMFQGIAPGEYKLFAWADLEPGAHMDPEFLKPYESKGVVLRVEESGRYTQSIMLLPLDTRSP